MGEADRAVLSFREISGLKASRCTLISDTCNSPPPAWWGKTARLACSLNGVGAGTGGGKPKGGVLCNFTSVSQAAERDDRNNELAPTTAQLVKHPLASLAYVPRELAIFVAGAAAGAAEKTVTAPLDRIKILMQTHGVRAGQNSAKKAIGFLEAIALIGKDEGFKGYWKGNFPQVIRIIPYSAVQLCAYETYKMLFSDKDRKLSVLGRLAAGACAGMTSTFY